MYGLWSKCQEDDLSQHFGTMTRNWGGLIEVIHDTIEFNGPTIAL
jgi:hypothetical protein